MSDFVPDPNMLLAGGGFTAILRYLLRVPTKDLEVCHLRMMRSDTGYPWDKQVGVHLRADGTISVTPITLAADSDDAQS